MDLDGSLGGGKINHEGFAKGMADGLERDEVGGIEDAFKDLG